MEPAIRQGVERLGIALEPEADYERRSDGGGGCEDPRITFVEPLQRYVMTYAAFSSQGPRIALAVSQDLFHWKRLGLAPFDPYQGIGFVHVDNKDASSAPSLFPITLGKCRWPCSIARFSPALVPRKPPAKPRLVMWISIMKAFGFPTARWPWRVSNRITSACLIHITGWPLRLRPGSGSRSAAALRPS